MPKLLLTLMQRQDMYDRKVKIHGLLLNNPPQSALTAHHHQVRTIIQAVQAVVPRAAAVVRVAAADRLGHNLKPLYEI